MRFSSGPLSVLGTGEGDTELLDRLDTLRMHGIRVESLDLSYTRVTDAGLRAVAERWPGMQSLNISRTRVTDAGLRAVAELWPGMHTLDVSDTRVTDAGLRSVVERCPGMRTLRISRTQVTDDGLRDVAKLGLKLEFLELSDTKVNLPAHLKGSHDAPSLLQYFREARVAGSRPLLEVKVPILGLGKVGKTQLARRLAPHDAAEQSCPFVPNAESTHAFVQRRMNLRIRRAGVSHDYRLRLFDFGGQPEMHSAHRFFLADQRNVYIVLISARKTQDENRLGYWLQMVAYYAKKAPVVVVVTHNDHDPVAGAQHHQAGAAVHLEALDGAKLSREYDLPIWVVHDYSNATGHGVERVKGALAEAVGSLDAVFNEPFNPNFFSVYDWANGNAVPGLQNHHAFKAHTNVPTFRAVCALVGQSDPVQQLIWLKVLRDLGLLHYVGDRPEVARDERSTLRDLIFHPEWVKTPVYNVVCSEEALAQGGVLTQGQLTGEFAAEIPDATDRSLIIALMAGCELVFRIRGGVPEEAAYLIIDRVPTSPSNSARTNWTQVPKMRRRLKFHFLTDHLLTQLLGRWFVYCPEGFPYYRDDVVLAAPECWVRIRAGVHDHTLDLEFDADFKKDCVPFLAQMEHEIDLILDPEKLRRKRGEWLFRVFDPDVAPPKTLNDDEVRLVTELAEALCGIHECSSEGPMCDAFRAALEEGFRRSINARGEPQRVYRLCWAFACSECVNKGRPPSETTPILGSLSEMRRVVAWFDQRENAAVGRLIGGVSGKNRADNLRVNYRKVVGNRTPPTPDELGNPHRDRTDRRRRPGRRSD